MEFLSKNLSDTKRFAADFIKSLAKDSSRATVVGLYGNLGSGKTAFVQCVAEIFGVSEHVTSPTFVILKRFKIKPARTYQSPLGTGGDLRFKFENLVHIDSYRLKSEEELRKLGFEELLRDPANLILIEWADLVADILPPDHLKIRFEFIDECNRKINF